MSEHLSSATYTNSNFEEDRNRLLSEYERASQDIIDRGINEPRSDSRPQFGREPKPADSQKTKEPLTAMEWSQDDVFHPDSAAKSSDIFLRNNNASGNGFHK